MERKYMMYEGEDTNTIDLLYEKATTECNGVKVIIPVQYSDKSEFKQKINEQLAYFENVYFDVADFDNNFSIVRSKHFQFSPISTDSNLHICLDNVYYPLDFGKLGISPLKFPIGLRFSLTDGLFPTPNRESIRYTKEAKATILKKIELVAEYFVEKYNESIDETDDFKKILKYYNEGNKYLNMFDQSLEITSISNYSNILLAKPTLKNVTVLDVEKICSRKDFIMNEYEIKFQLESNRLKECKRDWDQHIRILDIKDNTHFIYTDRITGLMKDYLKHTYPNTHWTNKKYMCRKVKSYKLGSAITSKGTRTSAFDTYYDILELRNIPKSKWRTAIQEFQTIVNSMLSNFTVIENIQIPESWLVSRKKTRTIVSGGVVSNVARKIKLKGEFIGKELTALERDVYGKYSKQVSTTYNFENAEKIPRLMIYGKAENGESMDKLFSIVRNNHVRLVIFSERELKNINQLNFHNWISIDTFMKGENKTFKRIATSIAINNLMQEYRQTFEKASYMDYVSVDIANKLKQLYDYKTKHFRRGNDEMLNAILELAEANTLFDMEIYSTYKEIKTILNKLPFINILFDKFGYSDNKNLITVIIDMFKYHKTRIDWKNYNIKLTLGDENASEEGVLTEETLDSLEDLSID